MLEVQLVNPSHDRKLGRRHRPRLVIHAAAAQPQQLRLPHQRQRVPAVDHRFALSSPALPSAPDKKSFSSVSSPILACNVFTSTAGAVAPPKAPNTSAAPPTSCAFQAVIWFGCTSNCCAKSASVFSPLRAANATFALKPGLWVRRIRFVMLAPDPRHHRRFQADPPLIALSEFGQPPLISTNPERRVGWQAVSGWSAGRAAAPEPSTAVSDLRKIMQIQWLILRMLNLA